jgi:hypothetical protein
MTPTGAMDPAEIDNEDLGYSGLPLCREPWEKFYILRRGILPCCYGNPIIGQMPDYAEVWNSPEIQKIRRYLSRGKLSPYCLESPGCPIVQRILAQNDAAPGSRSRNLPAGRAVLRTVNRLLFHIPGKIRRAWKYRRGEGAPNPRRR